LLRHAFLEGTLKSEPFGIDVPRQRLGAGHMRPTKWTR
jgi:hypothetical protein